MDFDLMFEYIDQNEITSNIYPTLEELETLLDEINKFEEEEEEDNIDISNNNSNNHHQYDNFILGITLLCLVLATIKLTK